MEDPSAWAPIDILKKAENQNIGKTFKSEVIKKVGKFLFFQTLNPFGVLENVGVVIVYMRKHVAICRTLDPGISLSKSGPETTAKSGYFRQKHLP